MKASILVHRVPIETPVRTSFGTMHDRPSVLLRIEDADGHAGWGEVWCNYPSVGAEHRARLLEATVLPLAFASGLLDRPGELWQALTDRLRILAIQTGEYGPIAQCLAGLECALHDLAARRAGLPLYRHLGGTENRLRVYASGINPGAAAETAARAISQGYAGAKIKVGFGADLDVANVLEARSAVGGDVALMADANQGWTAEQALGFLARTGAAELAWLEEPLAHDAPDSEWRRVAGAASMPLAAGENFASLAEFDTLPSRRGLGILQPDIGKWGGIAQSLRIAAMAQARGLVYCPHWLGGGVGLAASLHVKAAAGAATGFVEVDFNDNPMRSEPIRPLFDSLAKGHVTLLETPGIGEMDEPVAGFADCLVWSAEVAG